MLMQMGHGSWYQIRIDLLSNIIIIPGIYFCIYGQSTAGWFVIALSYLNKITSDISSFMLKYNNLQTTFISFERCKYFIDIEPEKGYQNLDLTCKKFLSKKSIIEKDEELRKAQWLCNGKVEFINYSCKYRPELDNVLKNIS